MHMGVGGMGGRVYRGGGGDVLRDVGSAAPQLIKTKLSRLRRPGDPEELQ